MTTDGLPVGSDSMFQRRLRQLQSMWRDERLLPIGTNSGAALGSRLEMPFAETSLGNYLTPTIRGVVHAEVIHKAHGQRKLYSWPRIFDDLLSSQPLCFNLFGELKADLEAASAVGRELWPDRVAEVTSIEFEWSPGRGDAQYLGNRSAFDVVIFHNTPQGESGFIGIEVKYHENLRVGAAVSRPRYNEVARTSGAFAEDSLVTLARPPLQQIWLDHLLALSMLDTGEYSEGLFVFLYPVGNERCASVSDRYEQLLVDRRTFERRTLEETVDAIRRITGAPWADAFFDRYLDFSKLDEPS